MYWCLSKQVRAPRGWYRPWRGVTVPRVRVELWNSEERQEGENALSWLW